MQERSVIIGTGTSGVQALKGEGGEVDDET